MLAGLQLAAGQSRGYCPSPLDKVHVELVTGVVYTAPEDMLDSRPGTLMLTDCIDLCLSNTTCKAANFETGLCVLFSSSAQQYPGQSPEQFTWHRQIWQILLLPPQHAPPTLPPCKHRPYQSFHSYHLIWQTIEKQIWSVSFPSFSGQL